MTLTDIECQFVKDQIRIVQIKKEILAKEVKMWEAVKELKISGATDKWEKVTATQKAFTVSIEDLQQEKETILAKTYKEPA